MDDWVGGLGQGIVVKSGERESCVGRTLVSEWRCPVGVVFT